MEYLLRFDFDIRYIKEKLNKVVDTLSCHCAPSMVVISTIYVLKPEFPNING
jgi:hypothetical protein